MIAVLAFLGWCFMCLVGAGFVLAVLTAMNVWGFLSLVFLSVLYILYRGYPYHSLYWIRRKP